MPGIQTRVFNLRFIRLHNVVSRGLRVLQVWFGKLQAGSHVPFTIQTWLVECCRKGCPFRRLSSLHRAMVDICQSDHWVFWSTPYPDTQVGWMASSRCLPFIHEGGHCAYWDLKYCFYTLHHICASIQSSPSRWGFADNIVICSESK